MINLLGGTIREQQNNVSADYRLKKEDPKGISIHDAEYKPN